VENKAFIFDIKRDSSEDGPGIRTTVFFKGCPLACMWCQNPEGLGKGTSLSFRPELCNLPACGMPCIAACPKGALSVVGDVLSLGRALCMQCGRCSEVCSEKALETVGEWLTVDELYYRIAIDKPFFQSTGGGVTASGGECTMQMEFLHAFFKKLKAEGIQTAIETNGVFNFERFKRLLLPWLDFIYYDLKLIDDEASRRYTGLSNRPILENLKRLGKNANIPVRVRIPLVPGITDTAENLKGIASFLRKQGIKNAEMLPYNPLWRDKLKRLGMDEKYNHPHFMSQTEIEKAIKHFQSTD
jgi:pyruvate formate lyase activating enzyme